MTEKDPVKRIEYLLQENAKKLLITNADRKRLKRRNSIDVASLQIQPQKSIPWQYKDRISRISELSFIPEKIKIDDISEKDQHYIDVEGLSDEEPEKTSSMKLILNTVRNESKLLTTQSLKRATSYPCLYQNSDTDNAVFPINFTEKSSSSKIQTEIKFINSIASCSGSHKVQDVVFKKQSYQDPMTETQMFLNRTNLHSQKKNENIGMKEMFLEKQNNVYASLMPSSDKKEVRMLDAGDCAIQNQDKLVNEVVTTTNSESTSMRPFKCTLCNIGFRYKGHLDRHYRSNGHLTALRNAEHEILH